MQVAASIAPSEPLWPRGPRRRVAPTTLDRGVDGLAKGSTVAKIQDHEIANSGNLEQASRSKRSAICGSRYSRKCTQMQRARRCSDGYPEPNTNQTLTIDTIAGEDLLCVVGFLLFAAMCFAPGQAGGAGFRHAASTPCVLFGLLVRYIAFGGAKSRITLTPDGFHRKVGPQTSFLGLASKHFS